MRDYMDNKRNVKIHFVQIDEGRCYISLEEQPSVNFFMLADGLEFDAGRKCHDRICEALRDAGAKFTDRVSAANDEILPIENNTSVDNRIIELTSRVNALNNDKKNWEVKYIRLNRYYWLSRLGTIAASFGMIFVLFTRH